MLQDLYSTHFYTKLLHLRHLRKKYHIYIITAMTQFREPIILHVEFCYKDGLCYTRSDLFAFRVCLRSDSDKIQRR